MDKFEKVTFAQFAEDLRNSPDYLMTDEYEAWDDSLGYYQDLSFVYEDIKMPERATTGSAGHDFFTPIGITIPAGEARDIITGVKCRLDWPHFLMIAPRSSLGIHHGLVLSNTVGIIDADYYNNQSNEGDIHIVLRNTGDTDITLRAGTRIAQGIIMTCYKADEAPCTADRIGGIGSTDGVVNK